MVGVTIIFIFEMRKLRKRKVKRLDLPKVILLLVDRVKFELSLVLESVFLTITLQCLIQKSNNSYIDKGAGIQI